MEQSEGLQELKCAPDAGMMKEYKGEKEKFSNLFICFGPDKLKHTASQALVMLCFFTGETSVW